jgi:hypothetical protein
MIRSAPRPAARRPPCISLLLFTRGLDAALDAVCTFTVFSVLSTH